jgi:hypothetical protein
VTPRRTRKRVAYHEAGHAVACVLLRIPVVRVTIRPDRRGLGAVRWGDVTRMRIPGMRGVSGVARVRAIRERLAVMALAGPAAQGILVGHLAVWCCCGDRRFAHRQLRPFSRTEEGCANHVLKLEARASKILRGARVWAAVSDAAAALLESETLNSSQVRRIVKRRVGAQSVVKW